ncbi:hypothetical protein AB406_2298 [Riemerella anatipestifer]|uniref:Uncharacterized protein n=1 Tax=Riemerella anatipestifer TaxID=34085 RepID=A0A1S7DVT6_RIEAN|nr:hypothetical protein AB406_2298 [Riemerella anatipestifer]
MTGLKLKIKQDNSNEVAFDNYFKFISYIFTEKFLFLTQLISR